MKMQQMKHTVQIMRMFALLLFGVLLGACHEEELFKQTIIGEKEVPVTLTFGSTEHRKVEIQTRSTYDLHYESMVRNMYVFIFSDGQRVYGRYFDEDDLDKTSNREYWTVENMSSDNTTVATTGTLNMRVPTISGDAEIVLVANIDLDFMNLSEDRLGLIRSKNELNAIIVSMNQELPERNAGYFMMTGSSQGVSIAQNGTITVPGGKIMLRRLDAKVEVNVRVNPKEESNHQRVEKFTPESWQVVNIPKSCLLMPSMTGLAPADASYFNTEPKVFETTEYETVNGSHTGGELYGFSFYTLENQRTQDKKKSVEGNFHNRELRMKHTDDLTADNYGTYDTENGMWEYAPEMATYIIIKGELEMVVDPGLTTEQHLIADVTYHVHLGNFASDKDNYDILRNTHYKYTVNIKGVHNIEVEVDTSNDNIDGVTENQPGAMGHLYEAEEDIYTFDAHYGQRVYTIRASDIDVENMTWYVRTPFGREGIPMKDAFGQEIYNDLDYKWVEFMQNTKSADNVCSSACQPYPSDKSRLMSVIEVLNLIKTETIAWREGRDNAYDKNGEMKFTVFVNEFYYDQNPMNPDDADVLWKKFVNQPNRLMHILCKNNRSKDGDSSVTGSILTIRQRSIQTPYNVNPARTDLQEGWGCETVDEMDKLAWFYHPDERMGNLNNSHRPSYTSDNTSKSDGLYNTACLLNLVGGTGSGRYLNRNLRWDTYLDYSGEEPQMKGRYHAGLYSVLLRNRDLDGDGVIDPEELRWYVAALDQLCGLFLGDQGLSNEAQLYPISASREPNAPVQGGVFNGVYPWRLHVVSSTAFNQSAGNLPTIVWAEEGASTGEYQQHYNKPAYSPIRCVRNLGTPAPTASNIITPGENYPEDELVIVHRPTGTINTNSVYRFDFKNMNEQSLRYFTTRELVPGDEYSVMSRLYYGFETGPLKTDYPTGNGASPYVALKSDLENGISHSPTAGYRIPNVREGVVMHLYCGRDANWWNGASLLVGSSYSFGFYGNDYDVVNGAHFYSWFIKTGTVTLGGAGEWSSTVRYVRDWNP